MSVFVYQQECSCHFTRNGFKINRNNLIVCYVWTSMFLEICRFRSRNGSRCQQTGLYHNLNKLTLRCNSSASEKQICHKSSTECGVMPSPVEHPLIHRNNVSIWSQNEVSHPLNGWGSIACGLEQWLHLCLLASSENKAEITFD